MLSDSELQLRGRLVRSLGALAKCSPVLSSSASAPVATRTVTVPTASGCTANISSPCWAEGKLKTYNVPASQAEEVRRRVDLHRRFQKAAAMITRLESSPLVAPEEAKRAGKIEEPHSCGGASSKPIWIRSSMGRPAWPPCRRAGSLPRILGPRCSTACSWAERSRSPTCIAWRPNAERGVFRQRIGKLSEDTLGYALQRQDPASLFALGCAVARRLKRNGVLHSDWARGRVVAAVDGIKICSSFFRCCDACMEREVEHKVDDEMRKDTQYYHRIVAVVLVSTDFPVPLGLRFQRDGEDEVACALALLQELDRQLRRRFLDVLVADALYLRSDFVQELEKLQLEWVVTVKENQPELLAEAQRLTGGPPRMTCSTPQNEFQLWHAPEVYGPVADRSLRVVKTFRIQKKHRVELAPAGSPQKKKRTKEEVLEESTNYYATNLELGSIPPTSG